MGQRFTYLEILTPKSSPWNGITLPLPTGAARSTCVVVGQSTVWEPQIIHESSYAPEELKEGWRSQNKCVHILENPKLSLDLPPYRIFKKILRDGNEGESDFLKGS